MEIAKIKFPTMVRGVDSTQYGRGELRIWFEREEILFENSTPLLNLFTIRIGRPIKEELNEGN